MAVRLLHFLFMNNTTYGNIQAAAAALDLRINQLQNSAGVMSDEDQQATNDIEGLSKQLLHVIATANDPQRESVQHKESVRADQRQRPGESTADYQARMNRSYPGTLNESPVREGQRVGETDAEYQARVQEYPGTVNDGLLHDGQRPGESLNAYNARTKQNFPVKS